MKILEVVKNKIIGWLSGKKENVVCETKNANINQTTNQEAEIRKLLDDLQTEIKKLNSRFSFMSQKIEEMHQEQEQILCQVEQVLFHSSGSFSTEEQNINKNESSIENGKNIIQVKGYYRLN